MEKQDYPVPNVIPNIFLTILGILEGEKCQFSWTLRRNVDRVSLSVTNSPAKCKVRRRPRSKKTASSGTPLRSTSWPLEKESTAKAKKTSRKTPSAKARDWKRRQEYRQRKRQELRAQLSSAMPPVQQSTVSPAGSKVPENGSEPMNVAKLHESNKPSECRHTEDLDKVVTASPCVDKQLEPGLPDALNSPAREDQSDQSTDTSSSFSPSEERSFLRRLAEKESDLDSDDNELIACSYCCRYYDESALKRCSSCKRTRYCSKQCQASHWPSHKTVCRNVQAAMANLH